MEKQGEAREKVLSAKRGKTRGEESRCRSAALYKRHVSINDTFVKIETLTFLVHV